jgi:hypothetical protein
LLVQATNEQKNPSRDREKKVIAYFFPGSLTIILFVVHLPAFFCTLPAHFSTFTTMGIVVLSAFVATGRAYFSAYPAYNSCMCAAERHHLRCRIADRCTFHIQLYTLRHHLHIFFLRA